MTMPAVSCIVLQTACARTCSPIYDDARVSNGHYGTEIWRILLIGGREQFKALEQFLKLLFFSFFFIYFDKQRESEKSPPCV